MQIKVPRSWRPFNNCITASPLLESRLPVGSSASKMLGRPATARATATAFDTATVTIRNGSNIVLQTLGSWSNLDAAAGYVQKSFAVSGYGGQTLQIHFQMVENSSIQTSFVIDNVSLK